MLFPLEYYTHWWYLSKGLSSDQNEDHMKKLCPWEVDVPTYHFVVHKIIGISSSRFMFMVNHS